MVGAIVQLALFAVVALSLTASWITNRRRQRRLLAQGAAVPRSLRVAVISGTVALAICPVLLVLYVIDLVRR